MLTSFKWDLLWGKGWELREWGYEGIKHYAWSESFPYNCLIQYSFVLSIKNLYNIDIYLAQWNNETNVDNRGEQNIH